MAATTTTHPPVKLKTSVCFSFAAYSKDLIAHLHHHSDVPVAHGLTEIELSAIESSFNFTFPPDLRAILREGLPVGHGFPNWRSSSPEQLHILINLPILGLCKAVSRKQFWHRRWGDRPEEDDEAVELAKRFLKNLPVLIPVYRNCYIPTTPCLLGNPVFYVNGSEVKLCSYDIVGLFEQIKFKEGIVSGMRLCHFLTAPAWAATEARRIEFWTELVELRRKKWWCGNELGRCMEDVRWKLKTGGWKEEDLDEMMMVEMNDGDERSFSVSPSSSSVASSSSSSDDGGGGVDKATAVMDGGEGVVKVLSRMLLRGGWSRGDVVETFGCLMDEEDRTLAVENCGGGGDSLF